MSWSAQDEKYEPLPSTDKEANLEASASSSTSDSETLPPNTRRFARKRLFLALASGSTLLFVFFSLLFIGTSLSTAKTLALPYADIHAAAVQTEFLTSKPWNASRPSPCGSTIESARAAGCQWSSMIWAWFPAACYDWDLEEQFLAESDWEWFASQDLHPDEKLSRERVLRGDESDAYVTGTYHKTH